ncbi:MAG: hypothetical protein HDS37_04765 [Bacteroides sp.]|nr:hypothetical protein [Bacteroides sp.]
MSTDNQERIDAYLRGEMSSEERTKFESDLKTDSALNKDYIETKAISEAIGDRKKKLDMMTRWDNEEELILKLEHRRKTIRNLAIGMSVAACTAIGFLTIRPLFFYSSPSPTNDFVMPDLKNEQFLRDNGNSMDYLDSLITSKDYKRALVYTDSLILDCNNELSLYKAKVSLTEKENADKENCEEYLEDLEWRRANLLVALGHMLEAKNNLRQIVKKEGYYSEQADSLLNTLTN